MNRLERVFRKSLRQRPDLWVLKLQVFPGAHTVMPADFLILSDRFRYLVECKQVTIKEGVSPRFACSRLTQLPDLKKFQEQSELNISYVLIGFVPRMLKKGFYFLLPLINYLALVEKSGRKSLSLMFLLQYASEYRLEVLPGSVFNLSCGW